MPDEITTISIDEHLWRHTRRDDKCVTIFIDLTPVRHQLGTARLVNLGECRSKQAFSNRFATSAQAWRDRIEIVAMDGFTESRKPLTRSSINVPTSSCTSIIRELRRDG